MTSTHTEISTKLRHLLLSNLAKFTTVVSAPTELADLSYSLVSDVGDNSKFLVTTNTSDAH